MSVERFARKELLTLGGGSATRVTIGKIPGLINLGAGDPDFDQPKFIADAVYKAMLEGHTHYAFTGDPEFKKAIAEYYTKYGITVDPETQVTITSGGSQAIFQAFAAVLNPGDEIIILDPAYTGYNQPAAYFGAKIVRAKMKKDKSGLFRPDVNNIKAAATANTKALMICNPDNPSGIVYTKKELEEIAKLAVEKDFVVFDDMIYTEFIWGGRKYIPIFGMPGMQERTMVLSSFSKTFAWTGCRAGFIIAGPQLSELLNRVPIGICSVPVAFQKAGIEALKNGWDFVEEMRRAYEERIKYCVKRMNEIPGVKCPMPEGAFYLFPEISELGVPSTKFCEGIFKEEKLRIVPGTNYGPNGEGHVRLALVIPLKTCEEVMDRFERYVKKLKP
ncbi:MAG: pyridoxal phosphate-dependent aminotransferase [Candidatus Bathyarchaeia archaeon]